MDGSSQRKGDESRAVIVWCFDEEAAGVGVPRTIDVCGGERMCARGNRWGG